MAESLQDGNLAVRCRLCLRRKRCRYQFIKQMNHVRKSHQIGAGAAEAGSCSAVTTGLSPVWVRRGEELR